MPLQDDCKEGSGVLHLLDFWTKAENKMLDKSDNVLTALVVISPLSLQTMP